jgi:hypothetical protein
MRRIFAARNVLATLALFASLAGTSFAKVTINASRIKTSSLTGKDIKDRGLSQLTFSQATIAALDKNKGIAGNTGPQGAQGPQGLKGQKGDTGASAPHAFSYIKSGDYQYITAPRINPGSDQDCDDVVTGGDAELVGHCNGSRYLEWYGDCGSSPHYCNLTGNLGTAGAPLAGSNANVLRFTNGTNGGYLTLDRPGTIIVTANAVLLHRFTTMHTRVSCQPQVRLAASPGAFTRSLGAPVIVSSNLPGEIKNLTVTGGVHLTTAGAYDFQLNCKELDENDAGNTSLDWRFVKGNVNAISTEQ